MVQIFCPKCGEALKMRYRDQDFNGTYGLLACACSIHPVMADIPIIFWKRSSRDEELLEMTKHLIPQGEYKSAFLEFYRHKMHKPSQPGQTRFAGFARNLVARVFRTKHRELSANDDMAATESLFKNPSEYLRGQLIDFYFQYFGGNWGQMPLVAQLSFSQSRDGE